jgi:hypothetical protein
MVIEVAAIASEAIRTSRSESLAGSAIVSSRSARIKCWPCEIYRVFIVVVRPPCTSSQGSTPCCPPTSPVRSDPAWSSPTTETSAAAAPKAIRLRTTLPAPPGIATSRVTVKIGTGASGLIRLTSPYT